jgi:hypothetical protein
MEKIELPEKLSELIEVALEDLEKVERLPKVYRVEMSTWHRQEEGLCSVCLAGVVIAMRLGLAPTETLKISSSAPNKTQKALLALNATRCGAVQDAVLYLGGDFDKAPAYVSVTAYSRDPAEFKKDLRAIVEHLKGVGL